MQMELKKAVRMGSLKHFLHLYGELLGVFCIHQY
jgi:hypothetical protein